jgi:SAM-dependent methyltransferase
LHESHDALVVRPTPANTLLLVATQSQLYERLAAANLDPELSWTEAELPEHERTKHVHRLHPYLGKFVPQLVEIFLRRYFDPGQRVLDPFAGSGTTLVECSTFGANSIGVDISAFNVLLARAKTAVYNPFVVEHDLRDALARLARFVGTRAEQLALEVGPRETAPETATPGDYLGDWYDARTLAELFFYRSLLGDYESGELMALVLSRAARSARLTTHFALDFPKKPQTEPYLCAKHRKICQPAREAYKFLRRYTLDTIERVREYERLRSDADATVLHGDARTADYGARLDGVITSPPYPGRIDYHEQHRYAYELFGLEDRRSYEIGAAQKGTSKAAVGAYVEDMVGVFENARRQLRKDARIVIVIDDSRSLYDQILGEAGVTIDERLKRHVNRRTGRRSGEFFEEIILART